MSSAERLLKLLALLEGRIDWTAGELSRRLEVTPRTIRRDMTRLRDLGYPVEAVAGPGGGYRLGAGGKLPPLLLDDDEALAVAVGLRLTATSAIGGLEESSLSAMAKLEHVLPPRLRSRLGDISEATVTTRGAGAAIDHEGFAEVASTIRRKERIRFDYTDNAGRQTARHVEPVRLVHTGRQWYLVCFDLERDDWRTFRFDRLSNARATGMRAKPRQGPDPVELVHRGTAVDAWSIRTSVVLDTPGSIARRYIAPNVGTVEDIDDQTSRLTIGADEIEWVARYLVGLPVSFRVENPPELERELARVGRDVLLRFGSDGLDGHDPSSR